MRSWVPFSCLLSVIKRGLSVLGEDAKAVPGGWVCFGFGWVWVWVGWVGEGLGWVLVLVSGLVFEALVFGVLAIVGF